jgi:hypothetical protein
LTTGGLDVDYTATVSTRQDAGLRWDSMWRCSFSSPKTTATEMPQTPQRRPNGLNFTGYTRGSRVFRSLCVAPPVLVTRSGDFLIGGFFFEGAMSKV